MVSGSYKLDPISTGKKDKQNIALIHLAHNLTISSKSQTDGLLITSNGTGIAGRYTHKLVVAAYLFSTKEMIACKVAENPASLCSSPYLKVQQDLT